MAGQNLLDERAARTRHSKHENGNRRRIALTREAMKQVLVEGCGHSLEESKDTRLVVMDLASFQGIAFSHMLEGAFVILAIVEGFRCGKVDIHLLPRR